MTKKELLERLKVNEWDDFEVKKAEREVPKDVWKTVSAFSNTNAGIIVFGITEKGVWKRIESPGTSRTANVILNETENSILAIIREHEKISYKELSGLIKKGRPTIYRCLRKLKNLNLIEPSASNNKNGFWKIKR